MRPCSRYALALLALTCFLKPDAVLAQGFSPVLTGSVGFADSQPDLSRPHRYTAYPELELSHAILGGAASRSAFGGGLYWGFWSDRDDPGDCRDCINYAYRTHLVGMRLLVSTDNTLLPVLLHLGISKHFVDADYMSGEDYGGQAGQARSFDYSTVEGGIRLNLPVQKHLRAGAGGRVLLPLQDRHQPARVGLVVSLSYKR